MAIGQVRCRTWIEYDGTGWYCALGIWLGKAKDSLEDLDPDETMRVGPWDTETEAKRELKGDFRRLVNEAMKAFADGNGGMLVDKKRYPDDDSTPQA